MTGDAETQNKRSSEWAGACDASPCALVLGIRGPRCEGAGDDQRYPAISSGIWRAVERLLRPLLYPTLL